jgi:magnesium chelatase subunit I
MGRPNSIDVLTKMLKDNYHNNKNKNEPVPNNGMAYCQQHEMYKEIMLNWAERYKQSDLRDIVRNYIARLYIKHNLESIRAIEAMQQGAVLYSITKDRDHATMNDVIHLLPVILKHRLDTDSLIRIINDTDSKGITDGKLSAGIKKSSPEKISGKDYMPQSAAL